MCDGDNVIAEYDHDNFLLRKYIYGPGVDEPVCMIDVVDNDAEYYYHRDGLGSVVALSDSNGDTVQTYEYSIYGQVAASDPNFLTNPYLFTGRRFDIETGLYYYRARYYNPYIGRFMQTNPVGYDDGINWYSYCANNPLGCLDPSGGCASSDFLSEFIDQYWATIDQSDIVSILNSLGDVIDPRVLSLILDRLDPGEGVLIPDPDPDPCGFKYPDCMEACTDIYHGMLAESGCFKHCYKKSAAAVEGCKISGAMWSTYCRQMCLESADDRDPGPPRNFALARDATYERCAGSTFCDRVLTLVGILMGFTSLLGCVVSIWRGRLVNRFI